MYAARPRYASVLPPPVGKNSSSTLAVSPERRGSVGRHIASTCSRMNAIWKVNHEWAFGPRASTCSRAASQAERRLLRPQRRDLGGDPLLRHDLVHEPEAPQRLGVRAEERQALRRAACDTVVASATASSASGCRCSGRRIGEVVLGGEPLGIPLHDGRQPRGDRRGVGLGERAHVEQRVRDLDRLGERRLDGRQPRREHPGGAAGARRDVPVDRAGAPDGELQPVAVLQPQPAQLVVELVVRLEQVVAHRQEHLRAAGLHGQGGLVQPRVDRDEPRGLPVVAQGRLDEPLATSRVVVDVDAQDDVVLQRVLRCRARSQLGQGQPHRDVCGGAPEPPLRCGRCSSAPRCSPARRRPTTRAP